MLRLRQVKSFEGLTESGQQRATGRAVTFDGDVGEFAHCEFTVYLRDYETDAELIAEARQILLDAVGRLHHEIAAPK